MICRDGRGPESLAQSRSLGFAVPLREPATVGTKPQNTSAGRPEGLSKVSGAMAGSVHGVAVRKAGFWSQIVAERCII